MLEPQESIEKARLTIVCRSPVQFIYKELINP